MRRATRDATLLLGLLIACASPVHAQPCDGRASFNLSPTHLEVGAGAGRRGHAVGFAAGHGTDELFAIAAVARHTFAPDDTSTVVAATIGVDQPVRLDNRLHVCPLISVGYASGGHPDARRGRLGGMADMRAIHRG
jgi:hypothetical protein